MPDLTDFRAQFPRLTDTVFSDELVTSALQQAILFHAIREVATLYCAAHLLVLDSEVLDENGNLVNEPDGGSGVVTSEQVGPRRYQYMTQAGENERRAFFVTSSYGRRFLALEDRTLGYGISARVVG